uniref:FBA domain-containing protein n=1 Tax=Arcella intermedia TaxID=1963864 RepID=A0A6B2KYC7_9EUKA
MELEHYSHPNWICHTPLKQRTKNHKEPQVIHCHDMAGNYLEDRLIHGGTSSYVYNFKYWQFIDIFIYFSHDRITIPPPSWTSVAHKNGVKVLGTFITEWEGGLADNSLLLTQQGDTFPYADQMIEIAKFYQFDGWFFNFESHFSPDQIPNLLKFLQYITQKIHQVLPGSLILWYDSVITTGKVAWQNALNPLNKIFFDGCDGIFLNYGWNEKLISESSSLAGERKLDVFTGIDIFGRGTFGGGGFQTHKALEVIHNQSNPLTSIALFAPGWTLECQSQNRKTFDLTESKYWTGRNFINVMAMSNTPWDFQNKEGWKQTEEVPPHGGKKEESWVTSFKWCKRSKVIDLYELGLSELVLNDSPVLNFSVWIKGTPPNTADFYFLKITLLDTQKNVIESYDSGILTTSSEWETVETTMANYGTGLRYISWEDGGKDVEYWGGHYGAVISSPSILLVHPERIGSISDYVKPRAIPINTLPFITSFNQGVGNAFSLFGKTLSEKPWNNLFDQDYLPTHENLVITGQTNSIHTEYDYKRMYHGGSSLKMVTSILPGRYSVVRLFDVEMSAPMSGPLNVCYVSSNDTKLDVGLVFELDNSQKIYFLPQTLSDPNCIPPCKTETEGRWTKRTFQTDSLKNLLIHHIDIILFDPTTLNTLNTKEPTTQEGTTLKGQLNLGYIEITPSLPVPPQQVSNIITHTTWNKKSTTLGEPIFDVIISWQNQNNKQTKYVLIKDEQQKLIGRAFSNSFVIPEVHFPSQTKKVFSLQVVNEHYLSSDPQSFEVSIQ